MSLLPGQADTRHPHSSTPPNIPGGGISNVRGNVAVVPDELAEPLRDLAAPTRRARMQFAGQYALRPFLAVMRDEFGLIARKGGSRNPAAMPRGVWEVQPERVNNNAPQAVTYGSLVVADPSTQVVVF